MGRDDAEDVEGKKEGMGEKRINEQIGRGENNDKGRWLG